MPVSKKTLSWQVPHARRAAVFQRVSLWHLLQSFSPSGIDGNSTSVKSASEVSAFGSPYSGCATPGAI